MIPEDRLSQLQLRIISLYAPIAETNQGYVSYKNNHPRKTLILYYLQKFLVFHRGGSEPRPRMNRP